MQYFHIESFRFLRAFLLAASLGALCQTGCRQGPSVPARPAGLRQPLVARPNPLDLGSLPAGRGAQGVIELENTTPTPLEVTNFETSCHCLRVRPTSTVIEARSRIKLELIFDLSDTPDFRGSLSVDVTGHVQDNSASFRASVRVTVL